MTKFSLEEKQKAFQMVKEGTGLGAVSRQTGKNNYPLYVGCHF